MYRNDIQLSENLKRENILNNDEIYFEDQQNRFR